MMRGAAASTATASSLLGGSSAFSGTRQRVLSGNNQRIGATFQSVRTKRTNSKTKPSSSSKKAAEISRALRSNSSNSSGGGGGEGIFGLQPVNYATSPRPSICASPPPPPPKPGLAKYTFPISAVVTVGVTAYFYLNNRNDSFAYWESMQTGGIPEDEEEDDDADDDDDNEA